MSNDKIIEAQRKGLAAATKKALALAADQERLVKIIQDIMKDPAVKNELGMYLQGQFEAIIDSNGLDIYELLENGNVVLFKSEEEIKCKCGQVSDMIAPCPQDNDSDSNCACCDACRRHCASY